MGRMGRRSGGMCVDMERGFSVDLRGRKGRLAQLARGLPVPDVGKQERGGRLVEVALAGSSCYLLPARPFDVLETESCC